MITAALRTSEVLYNEGQDTCTQFLVHAVEFFRKHGVTIQRVMTDNGPGYRSKLFNRACRQLGIRHIYTKPYTPQAPTAKRNASYVHSRNAGPTLAATAPQHAVLEPSNPGSTTTITTDPTRASA